MNDGGGGHAHDGKRRKGGKSSGVVLGDNTNPLSRSFPNLTYIIYSILS